MASEFMRCPHCRRRLTKSAAVFVLGHAGGFVASGPATVPCPGCGGPLDTAAMIAGKYDEGGGLAEFVGFVLWVVAIFVLMNKYEFGFWAALGIATAGLVALGVVCMTTVKVWNALFGARGD